VGDGPGSIFLGNFNGQTDLLTVNAGSNDLTLISGFGGPNQATSTIASGGVDPDAAFAFSSGSGFEDLVVGNAGDGVLALFEGGPDGLSLTSATTEPNLPDPTALAFSTLTGGQVQFYAATAGRESAELVALSLGIETAPTSQPAAAAQNTVAQLVALHESSLPLVATVLTLTITVSEEQLSSGLAETDMTVVASFLPGTGISVGQSLSSQGRGGPTGDDDPESKAPEAAVAGPVSAVISPWERLVIGLDEALEQFMREHPNGVSGLPAPDSASDRPDPPPATGAPARGGPTSLKSSPNQLPSSDDSDRTEHASPSVEVEAIDAVIQSWGHGRARGRRGPILHAGRPSERASDALATVPADILPSLWSMSRKRIVGEPKVLRRTEFLATGSHRRNDAALRPIPEPGNDEPDLALASMAVAVLSTEWVHAYRRHGAYRLRRSGRFVNPVRRRRAVIE
jgi:hypothetical protein